MKTIRLSNGKTAKVDYITDWIGSDGQQFSTAYRGDKSYEIVDQDERGSIWRREN